MARTRGLGRAIGRFVGRDRAAGEDAGDVPERRRPTASARRLRVHQMTTEGRDMAEDVADMTDDVPEQPTEAPDDMHCITLLHLGDTKTDHAPQLHPSIYANECIDHVREASSDAAFRKMFFGFTIDFVISAIIFFSSLVNRPAYGCPTKDFANS
ncbi:hypothetical protein HKD37_11G030792 [Glycine soja]